MPDPMRILTLVLLTIAACSAASSYGTDPARVAVVFGSYSYRQATADEAVLVRTFTETVTAALDAVGMPYYPITRQRDAEGARGCAAMVA